MGENFLKNQFLNDDSWVQAQTGCVVLELFTDGLPKWSKYTGANSIPKIWERARTRVIFSKPPLTLHWRWTLTSWLWIHVYKGDASWRTGGCERGRDHVECFRRIVNSSAIPSNLLTNPYARLVKLIERRASNESDANWDRFSSKELRRINANYGMMIFSTTHLREPEEIPNKSRKANSAQSFFRSKNDDFRMKWFFDGKQCQHIFDSLTDPIKSEECGKRLKHILR